jgi:hypothetical protein
MRARVKTEVPVNYNPETHALENSCGTSLLLKSKFISDFQDKKNCRLQTACHHYPVIQILMKNFLVRNHQAEILT